MRFTRVDRNGKLISSGALGQTDDYVFCLPEEPEWKRTVSNFENYASCGFLPIRGKARQRRPKSLVLSISRMNCATKVTL